MRARCAGGRPCAVDPVGQGCGTAAHGRRSRSDGPQSGRCQPLRAVLACDHDGAARLAGAGGGAGRGTWRDPLERGGLCAGGVRYCRCCACTKAGPCRNQPARKPASERNRAGWRRRRHHQPGVLQRARGCRHRLGPRRACTLLVCAVRVRTALCISGQHTGWQVRMPDRW